MTITRHFVSLQGGRQVHYRRAGSGPVVVLLHQSPASSAEFLPLIVELAPHWTVIAPDTPGNGLSDPLPSIAPGMEDFADALVVLLDALGIAHAAIYGFHTGGACALAVADRHPGRVSLAVADGYTQMDAVELADVRQHYLPPFVPAWDGSHLLWAWARIREQFLFFPWYRRTVETRLRSGMPPVAVLHAAALDLMRAGDAYRQAYRAVFDYDCAAVVPRLRVPTLVMTARNDALYRYLDHMPTPAPSVAVARPADRREAWDRLHSALQQAAERGTWASAPDPRTAVIHAGERPRSAMLQVAGLSLHARLGTASAGTPLLLCHDTLGSARALEPWLTALGRSRPLLAVDLPGNGDSDRLADAPVTVADQADRLAVALSVAGHERVDLLGVRGGAVVAAELARRHPARVQQVAVLEADEVGAGGGRDADAPARAARLAEAAQLDEYGAHVLRAWNIARDHLLFSPWTGRRRAQTRVPATADLAPERLHRLALDLLFCLPQASRLQAAHDGYDLRVVLAGLNVPVRAGADLLRAIGP